MRSGQIINTIARREIAEIIANRTVIGTGVFFALWFSVMHGISIEINEMTAQGGRTQDLNSSVFTTSALLGIFIGYLFSGQAFFREKSERIIETLLCAPMGLRTLWFGKTLGVAIPAYGLSLASAFILTGIVSYHGEMLLLPSLPVLVHLFVVVPVFIICAIGLIGFVQLLLGMRENRVVNLLIFLLMFFALSFSRGPLGDDFIVGWPTVGLLFSVCMLLMALTLALSGLLSKERIITSIP